MKKIAFVILLLFLLFPGFTLAKTSTESSRIIPKEIKERVLEKRMELKEKRAEVSERIKDRLDDRRLKLCVAKEKVIQNRTSALGRLSENIINKFSAISERVQNFYEDKALPSGKTLENYDELVADIEAKKIDALAALENAQANSSEFTCDSDNPKGQLSDFRSDMQTFKSALHEYRTSIKNLIVAVKGLMGEENEQ